MGIRVWSDEDVRILREMYPMHFCEEIGVLLGKTEECVRAKACKLGLRHAKEFDRGSRYGIYTKKGRYSLNAKSEGDGRV